MPTAIGKALRPYQKVLRFLSSSGVDVPIGNSEWDEVPQWYKDYVPERREGSEGAPGY